MSLNSLQTLAKSAGDLLLAPYPQAAPAVADLDDLDALITAGWVHTGWLSEDGPEADGFEGDSSAHFGWNAVAQIRRITRVTEPMVPVSLLQWNADNLALYFPGSTYDDATQVLTIPESGNSAEQALLLRIADGDRWIGIWVAKVTARGGDGLEWPGDALSEIPVVFDVLSTGDDANFVKIIGIPETADESSS